MEQAEGGRYLQVCDRDGERTVMFIPHVGNGLILTFCGTNWEMAEFLVKQLSIADEHGVEGARLAAKCWATDEDEHAEPGEAKR